MTGTMASIRLGVDPAGGASRRISVPRDLAMQRQVDPDESIIDGPGWLLRRAVCVIEEGVFTYGQVTEYDGNTVTVTGVEGDKLVAKSDVTEVAPVIAVLLWKGSSAAHYRLHCQSISSTCSHPGQPARAERTTRNSKHSQVIGRNHSSGVDANGIVSNSMTMRTYGPPGPVTGRPRSRLCVLCRREQECPSTCSDWDLYNNDPTARVGRGAVPRETPARRVSHSVLQHDSDDDDENFNDLLETLVTETESANRHRPGNEEAAEADRDDELDHPTTYAILRALADKPVVLRDYVSQLERSSKRRRLTTPVIQPAPTPAVDAEAQAPRYQPSLDEYTRHVRLPAIPTDGGSADNSPSHHVRGAQR